MKLKTLMIIKAVVCLVLGCLLLLAPTFGWSLFGASVTDDGTFPSREYGAALIGTLLLTWFARNAGRIASPPGDHPRPVYLRCNRRGDNIDRSTFWHV